MVPLDRVAKTILISAADPDLSTSGSAYVLLDDGLAMRLEPDMIRGGVYKVLEARAAFAEKFVVSVLCTTYTWILMFFLEGP